MNNINISSEHQNAFATRFGNHRPNPTSQIKVNNLSQVPTKLTINPCFAGVVCTTENTYNDCVTCVMQNTADSNCLGLCAQKK
jgi:hypothetical protein